MRTLKEIAIALGIVVIVLSVAGYAWIEWIDIDSAPATVPVNLER